MLIKTTTSAKSSVILLLLGVSGVGKTSVLEYLQSHHSFELSQKYTTRTSRNTVSDERDFIFCSTVEEFPNDDLLIFQSYGHAFGIQINQLRSSIIRGKNHALTIGDTETATALKTLFPNQIKTILLYCEYDILKSRIISSLDASRALRWEMIDKEIQSIYPWLGVVDYILDCSMPFESTKSKVDELINKISLTSDLKNI